MKVHPDLSVCLVPRSGPQVIQGWIESLHEYAGPVSCEIILVVTETADWLQELSASFPETIIYDHNGPLSAVAGRNQALQLANGRYIMLCDDNIVFAPSVIADLINFMDERPEIGLVGPAIKNRTNQIQPSAGAFPSFFKLTATGKLSPETIITPDQPAERKVDRVDSAAMLIRRELLTEIGLLDEKYAGPLSDLDYCLRAAREGWHVYYLPAISLTTLDQDRYQNHLAQPTGDIFRFFMKKWFR